MNKKPKAGDWAEELARRLLEELAREKRIKKYEKYDNEGVDYYIYRLDGSRAPWQIKSSERGQKDHLARYSRIPCSVFDKRTKYHDETDEAFEERLIKKEKHRVIEIFTL